MSKHLILAAGAAVQGKGSDVLVAGDPVILTSNGGKVYVTKAPTITVPVSQATTTH